MKLFLILLYFASWGAIPHLLLLKKRPSATLAWLWAMLFIPYLGVFAYGLIGTDRLRRRRLKRRGRYSARPNREKPPATTTDSATAALVQALPKRDQDFFQLLSRIHQLPISSAETISIRRDASAYYPALAEQIRTARHHLHLEYYIWEPDARGVSFLELITAAARRGVIVRLLLDEMGSRDFSEDLLRDFLAAGGRFSWFQSLDPRRHRFFLNLRNHRKLQIIDGTCAFVGGMNIGGTYEGLDAALGPWRDVQMELSGPIAAELQEVFADDWYFATDEQIAGPEYFPSFVPAPRYPAHIVLGGPDTRSEPISKTFVSLLNVAAERVWIATGYFVPDDSLLNALELAAARGVDVRLLISEKSDHPYLVTVGRSYYEQLLAAGVRLFEYSRGINHAKVALADDRWSMVGSANLDYRSMRLNFELNVLIHSPAHNAALAAIFAADFAWCQEIDPVTFGQRPFGQKFFEAALRPLSPLL